MSLLIGLLIIILFLKLFLNISVGVFKLLIGLVVILGAFVLIPIGFALILPLIIIMMFVGFVGLILKLIF